jgi:hypothetical protein
MICAQGLLGQTSQAPQRHATTTRPITPPAGGLGGIMKGVRWVAEAMGMVWSRKASSMWDR